MTSQSTDELKECPFCEYDVIRVHERNAKSAASGKHYFARCQICHTVGPRSTVSANDAAEKWNRRPAQVAAELKEEPFGYFRCTLDGWVDCAETDEGARPLYEHPAAVQQVAAGLTESDVWELAEQNLNTRTIKASSGYDIHLFARAIEAKAQGRASTDKQEG